LAEAVALLPIKVRKEIKGWLAIQREGTVG
jgi:hypothetical protein